MTTDYLTRTNGATTFTGSDVNIFRCHVIASGLRLYAKTGMRASRNYTPRAMMAAALEITGRTFKGKNKYFEAADAIDAIAHAAKALPRNDEPRSPLPNDPTRAGAPSVQS